jgi:AmmeMemoRadiSam system protein B
MDKRREAIVAGIFYPDDPTELGSEVDSLLAAAGSRPSARVVVAPHASFPYSGATAALAWKALQGTRPESIAIIAPRHRPDESLVYLPESAVFQCPLGDIAVNEALVAELEDCGTVFTRNDIVHFEEHGIEVHLPFMKRLFPAASLVPVLLGKPSVATVKALAAGLGLVLGAAKRCAIVVSVDLAADSDPARAASRSDRILELVDAGDWKGLLELEARDESGSCGAGLLAALLASSLVRGKRSLLLGRSDSSDKRQSSEERLVHYAALAFIPE